MQMDEKAAKLLDAIRGIDLASADGRAGIGCILSEIERISPGAILQRAASIELRRLGCVSRSHSEMNNSRQTARAA